MPWVLLTKFCSRLYSGFLEREEQRLSRSSLRLSPDNLSIRESISGQTSSLKQDNWRAVAHLLIVLRTRIWTIFSIWGLLSVILSAKVPQQRYQTLLQTACLPIECMLLSPGQRLRDIKLEIWLHRAAHSLGGVSDPAAPGSKSHREFRRRFQSLKHPIWYSSSYNFSNYRHCLPNESFVSSGQNTMPSGCWFKLLSTFFQETPHLKAFFYWSSLLLLAIYGSMLDDG